MRLSLLLLFFAACASRPEGLVRHEYGPQGSRKTYELYLPAHATNHAPLVVALHRYTESGSTMAWMTGFNEVADREGFVVVYPNGPGRRYEIFDSEDRDDVKTVLAAIEDVAARVPIDRERIYVTGASNGGFLTYRLVCEAPETFAAAAPVMALMPRDIAERSRSGPAVPMLVIHGSKDRIVKPDAKKLAASERFSVLPLDESVAFWVTRNGCDPTPAISTLPDADPEDGTRTELRRYTGGAEVLDYRVEGAGHTWPGGKERAPAFIVGKTARDFSATEAIWTFFARHRARR